MATRLPFVPDDENVFDPEDIAAISMALEDVCKTLNLNGDSSARETLGCAHH